MPFWIVAISALSIAVGVISAAWVIAHECRHPLKMAIMYLVWPLTALYAGPIGVWAYHRLASRRNEPARRCGAASHDTGTSYASVSKGAMHCGAGCTLGDMVAESVLLLIPGLAVFLGWRTLWSDEIFSAWILDFFFAYVFGIVFQYFSIKPMHAEMTRGQALWRSLQADTLSLASWQVGMYGFMAFAHFWLFPRIVGRELAKGTIVFWCVMQLAMICGFCTAFPTNRWLIGRGIKEAM